MRTTLKGRAPASWREPSRQRPGDEALFPLPGGGGNRRQLIPGSVFFASIRGDVDDLGDQGLGGRCEASFQFFQPSSEIPAAHFWLSPQIDLPSALPRREDR